MFTGIVEEVGRLRKLRHAGGSAVLDIACSVVTSDARLGDSISVNGVCLTVASLPERGGFTADVMGETLTRTSLGALSQDAAVNLERALAVGGRIGGHLVQGHVDGVGTVEAVEPQEHWTVLRVAMPADLRRYVVEKGSITVDGTSLTVMEVGTAHFAVGLIPHTMEATSLRNRRPGDPVNLEVDVIAKYVEQMISSRPTPTESQS